MKDIFNTIMAFVSIVTIPFFMILYALYGIRVWAWNVRNVSTWDSDWVLKIPTDKKITKDL